MHHSISHPCHKRACWKTKQQWFSFFIVSCHIWVKPATTRIPFTGSTFSRMVEPGLNPLLLEKTFTESQFNMCCKKFLILPSESCNRNWCYSHWMMLRQGGHPFGENLTPGEGGSHVSSLSNDPQKMIKLIPQRTGSDDL